MIMFIVPRFECFTIELPDSNRLALFASLFPAGMYSGENTFGSNEIVGELTPDDTFGMK